MKRVMRISLTALLMLSLTLLGACSSVDTSSSTNETNTVSDTSYKYKDVVPPEISSDDRVMSVFFDITYYNVENYAEIYLGKDFKLSGEFDGIALEAPSNFETMTKKGFTVAEGNTLNGDSVIYAGDKKFITFKSPNGRLLSAEFFNDSAKSKKISDCLLVKFDNNDKLDKDKEIYPYLSVNGISGTSSLSEVITKLGYPSHFHREGKDFYSLDFFLDKKDLRNRITVYVNPAEDIVTAVSFSNYTK